MRTRPVCQAADRLVERVFTPGRAARKGAERSHARNVDLRADLVRRVRLQITVGDLHAGFAHRIRRDRPHVANRK